MAKRNRRKFTPARMNLLRDAIIDGAVQFPLVNYALKTVPRSRAAPELAYWGTILQTIVAALDEAHAFVMERPNAARSKAERKRQEEEVVGTCHALAQADLFKPPYRVCWVEMRGEMGIQMTSDGQDNTYDDDHSCIACLVADIAAGSDEARKMVAENCGVDEGIMYRTFAHSRSASTGRMVWYDLLHSGVMTTATMRDMVDKDGTKGFSTYTVPLDMPNVLRAVNAAYRESYFEYADGGTEPLNDDATRSMGDVSSYIGGRVVLGFMAAMNTSWVIKERQEPGSAMRASAKLSRNNRRNKREIFNEPELRKNRHHQPYILIKSFEDSMRMAAGGHGSERKKVRPHMRRGHIHRFWTGPRNSDDRKLISKFVEATFVNMEAPHDADAPVGKDYRVLA